MKRKKDCCPCCGFPTLPMRQHPLMPTFEICFLCNWQDDGQTRIDADKVYGGPNGRYSLTAARNNFKKYYVMYSPDNDTRVAPGDSLEALAIKKKMIDLFNKLVESTNEGEKEVIWEELEDLENTLYKLRRQRMEQLFSNGS